MNRGSKNRGHARRAFNRSAAPERSPANVTRVPPKAGIGSNPLMPVSAGGPFVSAPGSPLPTDYERTSVVWG